jgi:hypothetical protein
MHSKGQFHTKEQTPTRRRTSPTISPNRTASQVSENLIQKNPAAEIVQRAMSDPGQLQPQEVLQLQRLVGNRAVTSLLTGHNGVIQTKLAVGPAHDLYEQEADRVADHVMSMPEPASPAPNLARPEAHLAQRQEDEELQTKSLAASITPLLQRQEEEELQMKLAVQRQEEEEELQAKPLLQRQEEEEELQAKPLLQLQEEEEELQTSRAAYSAGFEPGGDFESRLSATRGSGKALPGETRAFMENRFGADFSGVRLHSGSQAAQLNREVKAQAFTLGQDIYLGEGKADLGATAGKRLLAHELTHVVQQTQMSRKPIQRWGIKVGYGIGSLQGHETLTEVAMAKWEKKFKDQIKDLEKRKKGEKGEAKEKTERQIEAIQSLLISKEEKSGLVAGSRFNDMLHNKTVLGLAHEIGKEGTLTHASHEGELQFLHSMASKTAEQAWQTQHKIMMWAEFCYQVGTGNIALTTKLKDVQTTTEQDFAGGPTIAKLFEPWGEQTVGWLFTGKTKESDQAQAPNMAIGSMLHMLQDSFCMSHAQREVAKRKDRTAQLIKGFNVYTEQSGGPFGRHSKADIIQGRSWTSGEKRVKKTEGAEEAVDASAKVINFWQKHMPWTAVQTYLKSILGLSVELEAQRPTNGQWAESEDEKGGRVVSASGRLFRKTLILDQFKSAFGKSNFRKPREVSALRAALVKYNSELAKELKNLTVKQGPDARAELFLKPQDAAITEALKLTGAVFSVINIWKKAKKDRDLCREVLKQIETELLEDRTEVKKDLASTVSSHL